MRSSSIAVALLLAACGPRAAQVAPAPCTGNQVAIVRNRFSQPVDIYSGRFILGTVNPGAREEFAVPAEATEVHFQFNPDARYRGPVPNRSDVSIDIVCR